jgi:hypothetical protein
VVEGRRGCHRGAHRAPVPVAEKPDA